MAVFDELERGRKGFRRRRDRLRRFVRDAGSVGVAPTRETPFAAPERRRRAYAAADAAAQASDPIADLPTNRNQQGRYWFNRKFKYRKTDANPSVVAASLPEILAARASCLADRGLS